MGSLTPLDSRLAAFQRLREGLSAAHRSAAPDAFTLAEESVVRTGLVELDAALGGGFPRGILATLEGKSGSGRSAVAARLLATATAGGGLGALIEMPRGAQGAFYPPALEAAGVDLDRLLIVHADEALDVARAADIVLRSAAFGVIVIPSLQLQATAWTRLVGLSHHSNALLVTLGESASNELGYFASLRVRLRATGVRFAGESGLFGTLAGIGVEAAIIKHKRAAPGKRARFACTTFDCDGAPVVRLRECKLADDFAPALERVVR